MKESGERQRRRGLNRRIKENVEGSDKQHGWKH
jgi:hypothetical protein